MKVAIIILGMLFFASEVHAADINTVVQTRLDVQHQTVNGNIQAAENRVAAAVGNVHLNSQQSAAIQAALASLGMFQQQINNTYATTQQQVSTALAPTSINVSMPVLNASMPALSTMQINNVMPVNPIILPTDTIQNSLQNIQF